MYNTSHRGTVQKIKNARDKLSLMQKDAAKAWGIPLPTLKAYEQNKRIPRGLAMTKLQEILDAALSADKPASDSSASPAAAGSADAPLPSPAPKPRKPKAPPKAKRAIVSSSSSRRKKG